MICGSCSVNTDGWMPKRIFSMWHRVLDFWRFLRFQENQFFISAFSGLLSDTWWGNHPQFISLPLHSEFQAQKSSLRFPTQGGFHYRSINSNLKESWIPDYSLTHLKASHSFSLNAVKVTKNDSTAWHRMQGSAGSHTANGRQKRIKSLWTLVWQHLPKVNTSYSVAQQFSA